MRHRITAALLIVVALASSSALAQPLTDRVPADAILYFGWRGTDTLGPAYAESHLAAVIGASKLGALVDQTLPQLLEKAPEENQEQAAVARAMGPLARHLWKRPTAIYLSSGKDTLGQWEPRAALICDAGAAAADFHRSLAAMVEQAGKTEIPLRTAVEGNLVVLTVGYPDAAAALKPQAALRTSAPFAAALKQVDAEPVYALFVDLERVVREVDAGIAGGKDAKAKVEWPKVRDALGLANAKRFVTTGAFAGKDWSSRTFLEAPGARTGLLALLPTQPMRPASFKLIPETASDAAIRQFDPAKVLATVRSTLATFGPKSVEPFEQGLAKVDATLGHKVEDVLAALGDQWVLFGDAGVGPGMVLANELDNPQKFAAALDSAVGLANKLLAENPQAAAAAQAQQLRLTEQKYEDLTVRSIEFPQGKPSWTIRDGRLYVGFDPDGVAAATLVPKQTAEGRETLADSEKFKAVRQRLGAGDAITGFTYSDLAQTAPEKYQQIAAYNVMASMFASGQGIMIPQNLLPPLEVLQQHLAPAGSVTWVDGQGYHRRGVSPFPGSGVLTNQQGELVAVGGGALAVSILLPSLNRARETANRVKCAANMRQLGMGMLLYSNDHKGKYPDDLGTILKTQDVTIEVFLCPSGYTEVPAEVVAGGMDAMAKWVDGGSPYVYVGKGLLNNAHADTLVLYEREDDHGPDGMNMLFADGTVQFYRMDQALQIVQAKKRPAQGGLEP